MRYIFLLFLTTSFLSCANTVKEADPISEQTEPSAEIEDLSGNYQLISLNGEDVSSEEIFLKIDDKGESLVINTGCNVLRVDFLQQKEKIKFQLPVSTKMYCEGKMENEENLNIVLPKISEIEKQDENILYLKNAGNMLLTIQNIEKSE